MRTKTKQSLPVADHAGRQNRSGLDDNPRLDCHLGGEAGVHAADGVDHGLVAYVHVRADLDGVLVTWPQAAKKKKSRIGGGFPKRRRKTEG